MTLRPYQSRLKNQINETGVKNTLAVLPTGGGKTVIMSDIFKDSENYPQIAIAHRQELVLQISTALANAGVYHRIISPEKTIRFVVERHLEKFGQSFYHPGAPTAVAGVDTLINRFDDLEKFLKQVRLLQSDECHHVQVNNKWGRAFVEMPQARGIGWTATPRRPTGQSLGRSLSGVFDAICVGPSMRDLINEGYLCKYRIFAPPLSMDMTGVAISSSTGDYNQTQMRREAHRSRIVGDVVGHYLRLAPGKRNVVFAVDVEMAKDHAAAFRAAGISAEVLHAKTKDTERVAMLDRFARGETSVIVNVDVLGEGFDCLSLDTEILTENGWKTYDQITNEDMMYSYNTNTHFVELVPIDRIFKRQIRPNEKMISVKSQHTDIMVTENHNVFYKDRYGIPNWSTVKDLIKNVNRFSIPICGEALIAGIPLTDDELKFIAWFITDGGFERSYVSINQAKDYYYEIRNLLTRLGFDFRERIRNRSGHGHKDLYEFKIPKGVHTGKCKRNGWYHLSNYLDKEISPLLMNMSSHQFDVFWDELMKGDGTQKTQQFCTVRKSVADRLSAMAVVRDRHCVINYSKTPKGRPFYYIRSKRRKWFGFNLGDKRGAKVETFQPSLKAFVWCVSNKNKTLISRRNGKIAILGNCPAIECVQFARPTASWNLFVQQFGRGLRILPGKEIGTIIDHVGNVQRHGLPDAPQEFSLDGIAKQPKRADDDLPVRTCLNPKCFSVFEGYGRTCPFCGSCPPRESASRPEEVEGDLVEYSPELLAQLQAKADEIMKPNQKVPIHMGKHIVKVVRKNQAARCDAQTDLRKAMSWWGGTRRDRYGDEDSDAYRRFFRTFGVDVMTAQTFGTNEATELHEKIWRDITRMKEELGG